MLELGIRGIGFWAPGVASWPRAREIIAGAAPWPPPDPGRPSPSLIAPNERRRAPETVLLAVAVAEEACRDAGLEPALLASVFVSTYGDLAINHYMCGVLADDPALLSPTRFHNSVHNAPSGYWSIATGAMAPSTAIAASRYSFATAVLETATQVQDLDAPMLLVAYDVAGLGPMAAMVSSAAPFGCALVLDRNAAPDAPRLRVSTRSAAAEHASATHQGLRGLAQTCPLARDAGPLLELLATGAGGSLALPLSPALDLVLDLRP